MNIKLNNQEYANRHRVAAGSIETKKKMDCCMSTKTFSAVLHTRKYISPSKLFSRSNLSPPPSFSNISPGPGGGLIIGPNVAALLGA